MANILDPGQASGGHTAPARILGTDRGVPVPTRKKKRRVPPKKQPLLPPVPANKKGKGGGVFGVLGNLVDDVKDTAYAAGPGTAHVLEAGYRSILKPPWTQSDEDKKALENVAREVGQSYARTYGPLRHGNFGEFAHRVGEHPLGPILDAATLLTAGGAAAGKVVPRLGQPGELALTTRTGERVVRRSSKNPVKRGAQRAVRGATTGATRAVERQTGRELPVLGEHARAVRAQVKVQRRKSTAETARLRRPFNDAFKPLKPRERQAVFLHAQGARPSELKRFVRDRLRDARQAGRTGEVKDHMKMLGLLGRIPDELYDRVPVTPKLAHAREQAGVLMEKGGDILEAAGKLSPEARALRPYLTQRIMGGARLDKEVGGFVGGPDVGRLAQDFNDLIYAPHVGPKLPKYEPQQFSGQVPPRTPARARMNEGARLLTSKWLPDPRAWDAGFLQVIGYAHALERNQYALKVGLPITEDGIRPGWYVVREGHAKPPRDVIERQGLHDELQSMLDNPGGRDLEHWIDENIVTDKPETIARWMQQAEKDGTRMVQISPGDRKQIFGDFRNASPMIKRFVDNPTNVWRTLTLNYRPAWVVNNIVGQNFLWAMNHLSPGGVKAYAQAVRDEMTGSGRYFPEELRYSGFFRSESGRELFTAGPPTVRSAGNTLVRLESRMRNAINRVNASLSDNIPRRAAWYHVAQKERALLNRIDGTNRTLDDFLAELQNAVENPAVADGRLVQLHDAMVQQVLDELVDFGNLSQFERNVIRRIIPFYSWIKGITKATARLGFEHPAKVRILELLAEQGHALNLAAFGPGSAVIPGDYPLGPPVGDEQRVLSMNPVNPFATVGGLLGSQQSDNPFLMTNPLLQSAVEAAVLRDIFSGKEYKPPFGLPAGGVGGIAGRGALFGQQAVGSPSPVRLAMELTHMPSGQAASRKLSKPSWVDLLAAYGGVPVRTRRKSVANYMAGRNK